MGIGGRAPLVTAARTDAANSGYRFPPDVASTKYLAWDAGRQPAARQECEGGSRNQTYTGRKRALCPGLHGSPRVSAAAR